MSLPLARVPPPRAIDGLWRVLTPRLLAPPARLFTHGLARLRARPSARVSPAPASHSRVAQSYWLQPGGRKPVGFEVLWRLNAQCQAALIYFAYLIGLSITRISASSAAITRRELMLSRFALLHAAAFGLVTVFPAACQQHEYVLWGGIHIMPPLLTQWLVVVSVARRHALHRRPGAWPHPIVLGALSGLWFWLGNSAIFTGREIGVAAWMRRALVGEVHAKDHSEVRAACVCARARHARVCAPSR